MASQVFSGTGTFSYTNNTGQNVRVVINFLRVNSSNTANYPNVLMSWPGVTLYSYSGGNNITIGRNLAYSVYSGSYNVNNSNAAADLNTTADDTIISMPSEIMLAPSQTFSISAPTVSSSITGYNIVVIPENG